MDGRVPPNRGHGRRRPRSSRHRPARWFAPAGEAFDLVPQGPRVLGRLAVRGRRSCARARSSQNSPPPRRARGPAPARRRCRPRRSPRAAGDPSRGGTRAERTHPGVSAQPGCIAWKLMPRRSPTRRCHSEGQDDLGPFGAGVRGGWSVVVGGLQPVTASAVGVHTARSHPDHATSARGKEVQQMGQQVGTDDVEGDVRSIRRGLASLREHRSGVVHDRVEAVLASRSGRDPRTSSRSVRSATYQAMSSLPVAATSPSWCRVLCRRFAPAGVRPRRPRPPAAAACRARSWPRDQHRSSHSRRGRPAGCQSSGCERTS